MIADWQLWVAGVLLVLSAVLCVFGAIGLLRFPDVFTRIHATSLAGVLGGGLVFVALTVLAPDFAAGVAYARGSSSS